jgi:hypothetical protein
VFNPYGSFGAGLTSGLSSGAQLADISFRREQAARDAVMDVYREELLNSQIADARNRAAIGDIVWGDVKQEEAPGREFPAAQAPYGGLVLEGSPLNEFAAKRDASGLPIMVSTGRPSYAPGDLYEVQTGERFVGGRSVGSVTKRKLLQSADERESAQIAESYKRRLDESILDTRERTAEAAGIRAEETARHNRVLEELQRMRYENEQLKIADAKARGMHNRTIEREGKKWTQYYFPSTPDKVEYEIESGAVKESVAQAIERLIGGAAPAPLPGMPVGASGQAGPALFSIPGVTPVQPSQAPVVPTPPAAAIRLLRSNPGLASEFAAKYGEQALREAMGGM